MFFKILKKDLARKKSMNIIIFIFIALCTLFMASSLSNMAITSTAIEYFAQTTKTSDYIFVSTQDSKINDWLTSGELVEDFAKEKGIALAANDVTSDGEKLEATGNAFLFTLPKSYNLVLDSSDKIITEIKKGEVALPYNDARRIGLEVGDTVSVDYGGGEKKFILAHITKDMLFGSPYMGAVRIIVSNADYEDMTSDAGAIAIGLYSVNTTDYLKFERELLSQGFQIFSNFDKEMLKNIYLLDMVVAAILIVVSIFLMLIAFVILRFTIAFTLQEDYREIGVMKAIGLKGSDIKKLYISKYLALSIFGAFLGVALSFPFSTFMTQSIQNNMALESSSANPLLNIAAGIMIVLLVLAFCYLTMRKVGKLSAVQAMRSGATGENYKTRKLYSIHKHPRLFLAMQMAINDILCNTKNYIALIVTFSLGVLMILLPLNALNTLKSAEVIEYFGLSRSDVYLTTNEETTVIEAGSRAAIKDKVEELEAVYQDRGIDLDFHVEYSFQTSVYLDDPERSASLPGLQAYNFSAEGYSYFDKDSAPLLKNEIAMTKLAMERIGASVGDTVHVIIGGESKEYLISGAYESMEMMGYTIRFAEAAELDYRFIAGLWAFQGDFVDRSNIADQIEEMKRITPDYRIQTAVEYAGNILGETITTVDMVKNMIVLVVLVISCLITILLMRSFLTRETGEIALLKSLGLRSATIRAWQVLRIVIVLIFSIIFGVLLSHLLNPVMATYTFGLMGASDIALSVKWQEVYVLYPAVVFVVTSVAALLSVAYLNKLSIKDIGNME
jgi:putative ABC transport system permease protein